MNEKERFPAIKIKIIKSHIFFLNKSALYARQTYCVLQLFDLYEKLTRVILDMNSTYESSKFKKNAPLLHLILLPSKVRTNIQTYIRHTPEVDDKKTRPYPF